MVKQLKFIALTLAISVFTVAISLFSTAQPVSLVQAADPTPTPPASVVTLSIAIQSNAATQIYVPVRFDPVPLNLTNGLTSAPGNYQFNAGTQVQVLAVQYTPSPGYSVYNFIRWEGPAGNSPVPPGQTITVKMDSDKSITGYYNVDYYFTPTPILTPTPNPQVTVTGYVYDNNTGVGIKGATVHLDTSSTTTDAIGYYRVSHVFTSRPKSAYLTVVAEGYRTQTVLVQVAASGDVSNDFYMALETTPTPTVVTATPTRTVTPRWTPTPLGDGQFWEVVTGSATNITETSATIEGILVKHVIGSEQGFTTKIVMALQYWEESNPTNKITAGTLESSSGLRTLTVTISGLKPDTVYMYQAIKASGHSPYPNGSIKQFRTLPLSGTIIPATPTPTPLPGGIKIQFYNQSIAATSNQIYTNFKLVNTDGVSIAFSNIKLRYYYTIDGVKPQNFWCDYSPIGNSNVTSTFVTMATPKTGADTYLEIGFTGGAGNLAAGDNITVQGRVAKIDWSNYTQTNDYSFNPSATTYVDWTKVTGYVSGVLSWGTEP